MSRARAWRLAVGGSVPFGDERVVGDAEAGAQRGDLRRFGGGFGAEAVVDRRGADAVAERGVGEEQEREAVGAARDGEADAALDRSERGQIGGEARDRFGRRDHLPSRTWPRDLAPPSCARSGARSDVP